MKRRIPLKIYKKPSLKNPRLVAAWGCIGQVGLGAAAYLRDKLGAEKLGEIEPYDFFDGVTSVEDGLIQEPEFPETKFYYWKNKQGMDLIICMADNEPIQGRYEYAELILDLAERFGVTRIYTICAFPTPIHHTAEPKVIGVVNDDKLIRELERHSVSPMEDKELNSLNALLLGLARKRGVESIYLLSEVPAYTAELANPKSSKAVLQTLIAMLGIELDMGEMEEKLRQTEGDIDKRVKEASREFIDYFTIDYRDLFEAEGP